MDEKKKDIEYVRNDYFSHLNESKQRESPAGNRYEIQVGKYGPYFFDTKTQSALTLSDVLEILNKRSDSSPDSERLAIVAWLRKEADKANMLSGALKVISRNTLLDVAEIIEKEECYK